MNENKSSLKESIDWHITFIPFLAITALCICFTFYPDFSSGLLVSIRAFLSESMGSYYLIMGLGVFLLSIYITFSGYGSIRLGGERPEHSFFKWGSMMFTAGLAADILFYSLCEWILYANEPYVAGMGNIQDWAGVFPLFHWGPVPWSFYMVLAAAFGFMLHVRNRSRQKYSESCRPLLGRYVDKAPGKIIDLLAVFALVAGTATTFALATPLLSMAIGKIFGIQSSKLLTIAILVIICVIYTFSACLGIDGVSMLAKACTYIFLALLAYVFIFGGEAVYIVETGLSSLGKLVNNFFTMATYTDPLRENHFPQNWTIFYWAYWIVWCVATPFFIGSISRGRTIRQTILGGYVFGIAGTYTSFIILGNYSLGLQMHGRLDILSGYAAGADIYSIIISIIDTLPLSWIAAVLLILAMITFYATSFDSLTLVACAYSYKNLEGEPDRKIKLLWAVLLILLPIALIFSDNSMANLQTVSIIAAFPVGIIIILIVVSFFKDAKSYLKETH